MTRYHVRLRVYDTIELSIDAPDGSVEQDVLNQARVDASLFSGRREWRVDEERSRVRRAE